METELIPLDILSSYLLASQMDSSRFQPSLCRSKYSESNKPTKSIETLSLKKISAI